MDHQLQAYHLMFNKNMVNINEQVIHIWPFKGIQGTLNIS